MGQAAGRAPTLDRKLADDIQDEDEVLMFSPPPGRFGEGRYGSSSEPGEAALAFALPSRE